MCGRYSLYDYKMSPEEFEERFGFPISQAVEFPPSYNIGPYRDVPVIFADHDNHSQMRMMQWQLVPSFAKARKSKFAMFNTRDDSFDKKPFWRRMLQQSRCIFPMNNFFEWKKANGQKIPYLFELADQSLISAGGIFSIWHDETGEKLYSASIITVDANAVVADIHPRMPFILLPGRERDWLNCTHTEFDALRKLIAPLPAEKMCGKKVSQRVNNIRNDDALLIETSE